jgi:pyruvate/2-oxoglutarate dehydrogenase complex dihydrolipoamide acyltransferase (E2) component
MFTVICKEHNIDMDSLLSSIQEKDLLPKKMMKTSTEPSSNTKGLFDNKRAQEFAESNGVSIVGLVGTGRGNRITIKDMKDRVSVTPKSDAKITAAAAKLAGEHGIDISTIRPSGKRGDILLKDVKDAIDNLPQEPVVIEEEPLVDEEESVVDEEEPVVDEEEPLVDEEESVVDEEEPVVDEEEPVMSDNEDPILEE